jgi:transposase
MEKRCLFATRSVRTATWSRGQVETRLANLPLCLIAWRLAAGPHHLSRKLQMLGHDGRLMPAKYVRPIRRDRATTSATPRRFPTMKFVATKTDKQLDLQALRRARERFR